MKTKIINILLAVTLLFGTSSCQTTGDGKTDLPGTIAKAKPYLRPASSAVGSAFLLLDKDSANKKKRATQLIASSTLISAMSADEPPSASEFESALLSVAPDSDPDWAQVVIAVSGLYRAFKDQFGRNTTAVLEALQELSLGMQDAATPYLKA